MVDRSVEDEPGVVDRVPTFDDLPVVIGEDEIREVDLGEMHGDRVGPIQVGEFRITDRQVTAEPVVELVECEGATRGD